jgi:serine/threonine protein kinase/tetratricopeptide (TPR) repeat protein
MVTPNADRNLLFGILALQMDFIGRDALIQAMNAWVLDKAKPLAQILVDQKALALNRRAMLEPLVEEHIKQHGNDAERSLASVSSVGSLRDQLKQIADPDIQASVAHVPVNREGDPFATRPETAGESTSTGQRFRILRPHAMGGLGEVFVARDEELHREVALKQIQERHADDVRSRARFLLEAEVTGGLEHPGIVPVYGLGQYGDGRPFYAMRFVRGDSLKDAIERYHQQEGLRREPGQRALEFRGLLGRFVDVCNAIAYAHSRGVLHRDLKPGNVMLGTYGETLVVDWGLAKVVGRAEGAASAEDATLHPEAVSGSAPTVAGSAIGTPQFMSPEQAAGKLDRLGPAADVYSLGATLYALLVGKAPFADVGPGMVLHRVQHGNFSHPRQLKPDVPVALEAICLKAMALRPEDRYASARALADDIEHWLADEPVSAHAEPWTTKARRWLSRHRTLASATAASVLASVLLLSAATVLLSAANERERRARRDADEQAALAQENEQTAVAREAETRAVLDFVEDKIFAAARPQGQQGGLGRDVSLRQAVEAALPWVDKSFSDQPLIEARLRLTLGNSFWYLGEAKMAADQDERACALYTRHLGPQHRDTLASLNNLANSYGALGRHAEALKLYEQTLALRKSKLGADHPHTLQSMNNLASGYSDLGRYDDALKLYEETLRLQKAKLGPDHPDTLASMNNLASSYSDLGRHADALKLREEAVRLEKAKLGPDHPDTLVSMNHLASTYSDLGRHAEALKLYEETLRLQKAKLGPDHPETLSSMRGVALSLAGLDRSTEALAVTDEWLRRAEGRVVNPDLMASVFNLRLRHFEKTKDAAGCRATAAMWEKLKRTDADSLYNAACYRAVTAAVIHAGDKSQSSAKEAAAESDRAMAWLKQAVTAGYKDVGNMKKDKDLDALRDREDFKQLLAALETGKAKK